MEAEMTILYEDEQTAKAVAEAVSPDNLKVPAGLYVRTEKRNNGVWTRIKCEKGFKTFIATIDDILSAISTAEKTLKTARKLE
ncbi:MAG: KEOPS complex subunit Pcc1 [Candidatus Bathyarchaeota archaeon]|nr:KEOPS complex subunit Pcc1 [Candidatus Bathyarchaeota archaeon]